MAAPYGNQTEVQAIWQEGFLEEVKQDFTAFINTFVFDEKKKLAVFDKHSPYLATKKIGKNNPRAEQIKTDNWARTEWNHQREILSRQDWSFLWEWRNMIRYRIFTNSW